MNLENKVNMLVDSYVTPPKLSVKSMLSHIKDNKDELFRPYLIKFVFNTLCPRLIKHMDEERALGVLEAILNGYINIPNMEYTFIQKDIPKFEPVIDMLQYTNPITSNIENLYNIVAEYRNSGLHQIYIKNLVPFLILYKETLNSKIVSLPYKQDFIKSFIKMVFAPLADSKLYSGSNNIIILLDNYSKTEEVLRATYKSIFVNKSKSRIENLLSKNNYLKILILINKYIYNSKCNKSIYPKVRVLNVVRKIREVKAPEFLKFLGVTNIPTVAFRGLVDNRSIYNIYITYRSFSEDMLTFEEFENKFISYCDGNPEGLIVGKNYKSGLNKFKNVDLQIVDTPEYYVNNLQNCLSVTINMEAVVDFCKDLDMVKNMIEDLYTASQYINLAVWSSLPYPASMKVCVHFMHVDAELQKHINEITESVDIYLKSKYNYKVTYMHDTIDNYRNIR